MHITKLNIKNIKSLEKIDLEFKPDVNVVVWDNTEGKPTIMNAIGAALIGYQSFRVLG